MSLASCKRRLSSASLDSADVPLADFLPVLVAAGFAFDLPKVFAAPRSCPALTFAISRKRRLSATSLDLADGPLSYSCPLPPRCGFASAACVLGLEPAFGARRTFGADLDTFVLAMSGDTPWLSRPTELLPGLSRNRRNGLRGLSRSSRPTPARCFPAVAPEGPSWRFGSSALPCGRRGCVASRARGRPRHR